MILVNWLNSVFSEYIVCSSWAVYHEELSKLKHILITNNYPRKILDGCVIKSPTKSLVGGRVRQIRVVMNYSVLV